MANWYLNCVDTSNYRVIVIFLTFQFFRPFNILAFFLPVINLSSLLPPTNSFSGSCHFIIPSLKRDAACIQKWWVAANQCWKQPLHRSTSMLGWPLQQFSREAATPVLTTLEVNTMALVCCSHCNEAAQDNLKGISRQHQLQH